MPAVGPLRVLLVEDDPAFAEAVMEHLNQAAELVHVDTVGAALVALAQRRWDAVLLDLTLPDATGLETVDRILMSPTAPTAVVVSNATDKALRYAALARGVEEFADKSLLAAHADPGGYLLGLIQDAIARRRGEHERLLHLVRLIGQTVTAHQG